VLGSIWARPAWNTWWTWDRVLHRRRHRAYLHRLLHAPQGIDDPEKRARFGAVYTLLGGVSAPITFMVIRLFRSIHPVIIGAANANQEKMSMTPTCVSPSSSPSLPLLSSSLTLSGTASARRLEEKVEQLKLKISM